MFYVYVLRSEGRFYIGYSADLKRRLTEHNNGSNYSTRGAQWELVYYEAYLTREAAQHREHVLKGDGRTRRALMQRVSDMLRTQRLEPFDGGEWQTGE